MAGTIDIRELNEKIERPADLSKDLVRQSSVKGEKR